MDVIMADLAWLKDQGFGDDPTEATAAGAREEALRKVMATAAAKAGPIVPSAAAAEAGGSAASEAAAEDPAEDCCSVSNDTCSSPAAEAGLLSAAADPVDDCSMSGCSSVSSSTPTADRSLQQRAIASAKRIHPFCVQQQLVLRAKSLAKSRARNKRKDPEAADEEPEPAAKQAKKRKAKKAKSAKAKAAASFRLRATAARQLAAAEEPRSPSRAAAAKPKAKAKCTAAVGRRALAKEPAAADEEPAPAAAAKSKRLPSAWNREMSEIMQSDYRRDLKGIHRFQASVKHAKERRAAKIEAGIAEAGAGAGVALPAGPFGCARCRRDPSGCLGCCPAKAFAAAERRHARG